MALPTRANIDFQYSSERAYLRACVQTNTYNVKWRLVTKLAVPIKRFAELGAPRSRSCNSRLTLYQRGFRIWNRWHKAVNKDRVMRVSWRLCLMIAVSFISGATLAIACLALIGDRPTLEKVMSWLDVETLCLLFGTFYTTHSSTFHYLF